MANDIEYALMTERVYQTTCGAMNLTVRTDIIGMAARTFEVDDQR